jgi:hypothetical protein
LTDARGARSKECGSREPIAMRGQRCKDQRRLSRGIAEVIHKQHAPVR